MEYIYWCKTATGSMVNFRSFALLDFGISVPTDEGMAVIVDMDVIYPVSIYDDQTTFCSAMYM